MSSNIEKIAAAMYEESGQFDWVDACDEAKADMLKYASVAVREVPGMYWNFDLDSAPRDGTHVILAMPKNKTLRSYWCKPKNDPEHWCMLSHKDEPLAWMPWPEHPFQAKANEEACETVSGLRRAKAKAEASDGVELVSRVAGGRTPAATSEGMDVTAGETATQFYLEDVGGGA